MDDVAASGTLHLLRVLLAALSRYQKPGQYAAPEALAHHTSPHEVDHAGYVRFRHWRLYGEAGLAGDRAAVWLYGEHLTVEFADEPLAQYHVTYQPDKRRLKTVTEPHVFETPHRSPQLPLWTLGEGDWLQVLRVPEYAPRKRQRGVGTQPALFALDAAG